ncbi:MAG: Lrp/AsnC family transcriptional regulator [archaeon]
MAEIIQYKLDLKDKKILHELDSDSRQPSSRIAKKIGLSTEVVNYRIKKLEQENIITQYQVIIDLSKLNIIQFKLLLSLQHMSSDKLNSIIKELKLNNSVKWVASCNGNWELLISCESSKLEEIEPLKNKILSLFDNTINNKAMSIAVGAEVYARDYLLDTKSKQDRTRILVSGEKDSKLDDLDIKILKQLAENARKPIIDIAEDLKISERIVNYRIKQLIIKKIITGFRIALNYDKLGIKFFKTFIHLDNPKESRVQSLLAHLRSNKNIIHNVNVLGNWDLEPEFEVYSQEEFNSLLNNLKDKFSDIIKTIDIITITKEHKFIYL